MTNGTVTEPFTLSGFLGDPNALMQGLFSVIIPVLVFDAGHQYIKKKFGPRQTRG